MQIRNGTHWLYLDDEHGYNLVHMIVQVENETDPKMPWISSWSLYDQEGDNYDGWTWHGPLNLFLRAFKPLGPAEQSGV